MICMITLICLKIISPAFQLSFVFLIGKMPRTKKKSTAQRVAHSRRLMSSHRAATPSVTSCLQGTLHQGDDRFSDNNRGRQCTAISLTSLILAQEKSPVYWTPADLDTIVVDGDTLYDQHRGTHDYLMPSDLPGSLIKGQTKYNIEYHDGFCGNFQLLRSSDPFYTVHEALTRSQAVSPYTFMVLGQFDCAYTSMIMNLGPVTGYYVFDSHARDTQGLPDGDGTVCLIRCANMTQVVAYIHHLATTIGVHHIEQFEFVPCTIKRATTDSSFYENISGYIQRQRALATQQEVEKMYHSNDEETEMTKRALKTKNMQRWRKKSLSHQNTLKKRHSLARSEPEPKRKRRERESRQRSDVEVKKKRKTRETVQRSEPTIKEARMIQRQGHNQNKAVQKKRKTRETVQRSEPTIKEARMIQRQGHNQNKAVQKKRKTRETVQRSEPSIKEARMIQRQGHNQNKAVQKKRKTRETVQRSEPSIKEARMIQRQGHNQNKAVQKKRKTRETVQRSEPSIKEARKTRETVQRSEPSIKGRLCWIFLVMYICFLYCTLKYVK